MGNVEERIENSIPSMQFVLVGKGWDEMFETRQHSEGLYQSFSSLMLNIGNMVEEDKLHYFISELKGWA